MGYHGRMTPKKKKITKKPSKGTSKPQSKRPDSAANKAQAARAHVLAIVRAMYGAKRSEKDLLAFDPNDVDALDPSILYEIIQERFGIEGDESNDYFSGFGGSIAHLIDFVWGRWDGVTLHEVEMPPSEYLEEIRE